MTTEDLAGDRTTPLLDPVYRGATVGAVALVFLAAFEALAVATVMPTVAADLDGRDLFAVAFSATLAASVVGMVAAGSWADRRGAVRPLLASVALFAVGLVAAGLAPTMAWLVLGRFAQGLGLGGLIVALYVLVAQVYAQVDRPRILGLFAAAWVLPGLVGPFLAGVVADTLGWRWVFLGVVLVAAGALALLVPTLRNVPPPEAADPDAAAVAGPGGTGRLALAVAVAAAVVALNLAGSQTGVLRAVTAVVAVAAALVAVRPLLPRGTLRAARGLPSVIGLRGLVAGAFFASESYLPYLLQEQYGAATWVSGLVLTVATLSWATASQVQGRLGERLPDESALRIGSVLLAVGVAMILAIAALALPGLLVGVGWLFASAGMGLMFPRITSAVLKRTAVQERGTATSAITISDSVGAAVAVAVVGLVFTAIGTAADRGAFVGVLVVAFAVSLVAVAVSRRT
ncbi:Multidrug efflux pump SdrM [Nocardioides aquaticus]|uniref:Multidrug efflux pump SdrM n=1 Tax=Nocardioides aquaticus TaxID=160826 RepID=A0ABX8EN09_9ACTN|nr:MFS transporter [Nocardioides aquaticus]QVT81215.1 Multidrug efflux pump SdrM [Nocardioides aquaticus]